jgi:chromate reductase, NAD(P)H dehydrogenase (quinone)
MAPPAILVIPGSARGQALSKRLADAALPAIQRAGGVATGIDLGQFELPLYQADLEARDGLPTAARQLQALIERHRGLLIASPEYNGSMPPLLLNALDWCSRTDPDNPSSSGLAIFADKPAALLGSSPGALGGVRALIQVRDLLGYLGMIVIPQQLTVPRAHQAFDAAGGLIDPTQRARLEAVAAALVRAAAAT